LGNLKFSRQGFYFAVIHVSSKNGKTSIQKMETPWHAEGSGKISERKTEAK
jgi:hypothetical protein